MTDTAVDVESQAHQLAARGRDVLVDRMRTAYSDAAAAQADLVTLDDEQIEAMVQSAADRADGLQWRRALAAVAAEEFGISATDALSHPAVVRAQALVGAPSYEQSLAEMMARPVPPATPAPKAAPSLAPIPRNGATAPVPSESEASEPEASEPAPAPEAAPAAAEQHFPEQLHYAEEPSDELEAVEADDVVLELLPAPDPFEYETEAIEHEAVEHEAETAVEPDPAAYETQAYDVEANFVEEHVPPAPTNPFAAPAPQQADEPEAEEERQLEGDELEAADEDEYAPPTEQNESAGVAAALAAISVPDPVHSDPNAMSDAASDAAEPEPEEEHIEVSFAAVHLGGVANLPTKREGLSVRLSADGLDIMQSPREIIGRLVWDEIEALEVPNLRMRRRQKQARARLVVRTPHGDASFEVPEISAEDLRDRVEPLMGLYGRH
jgi:chemotaxis protein histidine kinase CheA